MVVGAVQTETLCQRLRAASQGKKRAACIDANMAKLRKSKQLLPSGLPGVGDIESFAVYSLVHVTVTDGKVFNGTAWGISVPGAGGFPGVVITDDVNALYQNTTSFAFLVADVELTVFFFDADDSVMGVFEGFGESTGTSGGGGGSGSWS